ncbi:hypothetical protein KZX45_18830 [Georgenia sp. EYE_87]|uniref:hypothetical protein n=1 Tax=Georgenia sp. EYE_87 TaxID=2853448 RepID=UPI0020067DC0|nr:hypothetical protein [Georgenia sp. EYE_87]MCK6212597.1 hypothetical protein [Georgenia sp. EYE_87]
MTSPGDPRGDDAPLTEADVERMLRALDDVPEADAPARGSEDGGAPSDRTDDGATAGDPATEASAPAAPAAPTIPGKLALVLTPVASAPALAGLCAMAGIDVDVVPSSSGAVAALEVAPKAPADDWDISQLLGGEEGGFPPEAEDLAKNLSRLSRAGVVLLVADLATDVGIEAGLSGQVSARRYTSGEPEGDVPAGLILAGADQVIEDLILGRTRPDAVKGHQRSGTLPRWKAARMFGRGLRRRKP